jgi:hypothetical protein
MSPIKIKHFEVFEVFGILCGNRLSNDHSTANSPKWSFSEMCWTRETRIRQNIYMTFCEFCKFCEYFRNVPCIVCSTLRGSVKPKQVKTFFLSLSPSLLLLHIHRKQAKTFLSLSPLSTNKVIAAVDNVLIQSFKHGRFI